MACAGQMAKNIPVNSTEEINHIYYTQKVNLAIDRVEVIEIHEGVSRHIYLK